MFHAHLRGQRTFRLRQIAVRTRLETSQATTLQNLGDGTDFFLTYLKHDYSKKGGFS